MEDVSSVDSCLELFCTPYHICHTRLLISYHIPALTFAYICKKWHDLGKTSYTSDLIE